MRRLTAINEEIQTLAALADNNSKVRIAELRLLRKQHSFDLQQQLFAQYHFLNQKGNQKASWSFLATQADGNLRREPLSVQLKQIYP